MFRFIQTIPKSALTGIAQYSGGRVTKIKHQDLDKLQSTDNNQNLDKKGSFDSSMIDSIALVNGQYEPEWKIKSGDWTRLRLVHAGPAFFMDLTLEPAASSSNHDQPNCELQLLSKDGIYLLSAPREHSRIILAPGGRADVAVRCFGSGSVTLASGIRPGNSGVFNGDMYWNPSMGTLKIYGDSSDAVTSDDHHDELDQFSADRAPYLAELR